jgi:glycosyltransferase involved in cell wall biosynthesis
MFEFWWPAVWGIGQARRLQPWAKIVVDSVDVHFVREAAAVRLGLMDEKIAAENRQNEIAVYRQADAVIVVTREDRLALMSAGVDGPIHLVPNIVPSVDRPAISREREVLFVGGFNHAPNADGLIWFVHNCWQEIRQRVPGAKLTVVGSNPTAEVRALGDVPGVRVEGYVPVTQPHLQRAAVSIAPLRFGGGMKGKVCEALAAGMPLVTTPDGAAGIPLRHGVDAWIADDAPSFSRGVFECLEKPDWAEAMGRRGRETIEQLCGKAAVSAALNPRKPTTPETIGWLARAAAIKSIGSIRNFAGGVRADQPSNNPARENNQPVSLRASDARG